MIENNLIEPKIYVGNLKSLRTWADVRDAVRAYYILLTQNPIKGEYYNIGGNFSCTIGEMLAKLLSFSSYSNKIEIIEDKERLRPIDADLQIPDVTKFTNHTNWKPIYTFDQTILDLLNYWRDKVKKSNEFLRR